MANLKDIRNRISSVKNTQQITKAMKMVSAAKLRRAQEAVLNADPYSRKIRYLVYDLSSGVDESEHPLLAKREEGISVVVLFTSDRGLCGGLNNNLCKELRKFIKDSSEEFVLLNFGKKGEEFFRHIEVDKAESYRDLKPDEMTDTVDKVIKALIEQYCDKKINKVYLAYNQFKSVITQDVTIQQILPIERPQKEKEKVLESQEFVVEPSRQEILDRILPKYVQNQAYNAILNNIASEHGARMSAMDSATTNANDMIARLSLQYNRLRQAAITNELIEIISGAESL